LSQVSDVRLESLVGNYFVLTVHCAGNKVELDVGVLDPGFRTDETPAFELIARA
jgi:hypothetical protein